MPEIMTTKEIAKYLKLHEITVCKYAAEGKIPAIRIGRVWRFDKTAIDTWIAEWVAPGTKQESIKKEKEKREGGVGGR
jgi:excisionase family DNA binding protein